jgi:hypothetical protein
VEALVAQPRVRLLSEEEGFLEVYRTVLGTLQSVAGMLLAFFIVALIAFVIMRGFELRRAAKA